MEKFCGIDISNVPKEIIKVIRLAFIVVERAGLGHDFHAVSITRKNEIQKDYLTLKKLEKIRLLTARGTIQLEPDDKIIRITTEPGSQMTKALTRSIQEHLPEWTIYVSE